MTTKSHPRALRSSSESETNANRPKKMTKILKVSCCLLISLMCLIDEEKKANEDDKDEKDEKEEESKEDNDDENKSEDDDKKKKKKGSESFGERMRNIYFQPGGNPKPEAWLTLLAAIACGYVAMTTEVPRKEIVFMTFLNDYLLKN